MKISIIGGTGFVGSHILDKLLAANHTPRLLVRPGSESRVEQRERCELVSGDVDDASAVAECLEGADAMIYLIGILREFPSRGITFDGLQFRAVDRLVQTAKDKGIKRFLLMSANGVKPDGTPYQRSKFMAEETLRASGLDWTIFRPSVIFGDPRGRMEFCTQLKRDIIDSPLPAPLFYEGLLPTGAGAFELAPVHVDDVAQAFVRALQLPETVEQTLQLCGPDKLSWKQILTTIASAVGKTKMMLPAPALAVKAAAGLLDRQPWFPITRDQINMLLEGNVCDEPGAFRVLGIEPARFDELSLAYLQSR
jgi:NADH dehydrogenase